MYIFNTDLYIATFVFFNMISNSKQQNEENITKKRKKENNNIITLHLWINKCKKMKKILQYKTQSRKLIGYLR
jgi:hypothetical protein